MNNRWVIPDIHGSVKTLQTLVKYLIVPDKDDQLYFLGDFIDRGPDSKGVIDYIMQLQKETNVDYIIGNHEYYCLKSYEEDKKIRHGLFSSKPKIQREWEQYGGKETLKSFGVKYPGDIPQEYIDWMKRGKYFIETDKYVLVHAGMNFTIDNPFEDTFAMLWARDFKVDRDKIHGKKVLHGHVAVDVEFIDLLIKTHQSDFIALDNGVYYKDRTGFGNLLAFNIDTDELIIQANVDDDM